MSDDQRFADHAADRSVLPEVGDADAVYRVRYFSDGVVFTGPAGMQSDGVDLVVEDPRDAVVTAADGQAGTCIVVRTDEVMQVVGELEDALNAELDDASELAVADLSDDYATIDEFIEEYGPGEVDAEDAVVETLDDDAPFEDVEVGDDDAGDAWDDDWDE